MDVSNTNINLEKTFKLCSKMEIMFDLPLLYVASPQDEKIVTIKTMITAWLG